MSEDRTREREKGTDLREKGQGCRRIKGEREREIEGHKRREQTRGRVRLCRDGAQPGTGERKSRARTRTILEFVPRAPLARGKFDLLAMLVGGRQC